MSKTITIQDKDYLQWVRELGSRYRRSQIKAAVKVNEEMLRFYWEQGRDIVEMHIEERWGESVMKSLSIDLHRENPEIMGLSPRSINYCKQFYILYFQCVEILPQVVAKLSDGKTETVLPQAVAKNGDSIMAQQLAAKTMSEIFSVPWGHHRFIIDKCSDNLEKALFFIHKTVENGWSRNMLLNFMSTDLYERQGNALTNFSRTLPEETSDLAQELTKDPYDFAFTGITGKYNERLLKDKLLNNKTLI